MFKGGFIVSGAEVNLASDTSPQTPYVPLMDRGSLGPVVCSIRLRFLIPGNGLRTKWIHIHPDRERAASIIFPECDMFNINPRAIIIFW